VVGEEPGKDAQQHSGALPFCSVDGWTFTTGLATLAPRSVAKQEDVTFHEDGRRLRPETSSRHALDRMNVQSFQLVGYSEGEDLTRAARASPDRPESVATWPGPTAATWTNSTFGSTRV